MLLHPLPSAVLVTRCTEIARDSGYGGISIRYLFTLCTANQEAIVDEVPLTGLSNTFLTAVGGSDAPVVAGWKLRGGSSLLRCAVAERVRMAAQMGLKPLTPDPDGRKVLSPTMFPDNLRIRGLHPLSYMHDHPRTRAPETPRILVTGSRMWNDDTSIAMSLRWAWNLLGSNPCAILVEGECPYGGADIAARDIWAGWGLPVDAHPPGNAANGPVQGPEPNARMVRAGAHLCIGYPLPQSRGTRNCMRLAAEAGIPVVIVAPASGGDH